MASVVLGRVIAPPEVLRGQDGTERHLIDPNDPLVSPIVKGDLIFGWEGDPRYALYVNYRRGAYELWRHEDDGVMRCSVAVPGFVAPNDMVGWLVSWLCEHDGRRGYDPVADALAQNAALEKAKADRAAAQFEEAADRLHFGLMKDVGDIEAGMSRRQFGGYQSGTTVPAAAGEQE